MSDSLDINLLRKKLYYKATRRGAKEVDMIFIFLLEKHLHKMDLNLLKQFENLLEHKDIDIYRQFMGYKPLSKSLDNELWNILKEYKKT